MLGTTVPYATASQRADERPSVKTLAGARLCDQTTTYARLGRVRSTTPDRNGIDALSDRIRLQGHADDEDYPTWSAPPLLPGVGRIVKPIEHLAEMV